ncbi:MAG: Enamine/imine deaminase [bacterium ADurb.Bin429]|nr:MAG: Enamine/imine deaminase [bacterium ADurb.Bin429]
MPLTRLAEMGLALPAPPEPLGIYVPVVRTGNLLFLCGQLPLVAGKLPSEYTGKVGASVSLERAQLAARQAALNCLSIVHDAVGLGRVKQIVRVTGYVSSASTFTDQPVALNGASELLAGVFGEAGKHARVAVGVAVLPKDACIEVDMIIEVE